MTIPRRLFAFLKALPTILGCLVFLFSIILPFYCAVQFGFEGQVSIYYWSFKADYHSWEATLRPYVNDYHFWFFDYWLPTPDSALTLISWTPLAMFIDQALALALGIASINFKRRILLAAPVCLSLTILGLMIHTGEILPAIGDISKAIILFFPRWLCSCPPSY